MGPGLGSKLKAGPAIRKAQAQITAYGRTADKYFFYRLNPTNRQRQEL